jgi:hypothetical protein
MNVLPRLRFVDVLSLQNKSQRLFAPRVACGKCESLFESLKGVVIVAAFEFVRGAVFWVAPNAVFKYFVPDIATAGFCSSRILTHLVWV